MFWPLVTYGRNDCSTCSHGKRIYGLRKPKRRTSVFQGWRVRSAPVRSLFAASVLYSPVLCSLPAAFVFTLEAQSSRFLRPFPLFAITKRNLLALICYTLACPASFSPLLSSLCPVVASICAVLHFRASVCISFMAFSLCAQPKNEKSENKTKYSCTSYV